MALEVLRLATLDADLVADNHRFISELLQEEDPSIDTKRGVLGDLLCYYSGVLAAMQQENAARLRRSNSLKAIADDPTLADDDIVDGVLSNFLISRSAGSLARGEVTVVLDSAVSVAISKGAVFTANGIVYTSDDAYVSQAVSANVQTPADRPLVLLSDGNYAFTIRVTASTVGTAAQVSKDTLVLPEQPPPNYLTSYATSDFVGGVNAETNAELQDRLSEGLAAKAFSGRTNMNAALRAEADFENVLATSIIGFGDEEMRRDAHTIFPVSLGGRVDWYVRTQELVLKQTLTKTAILVSKTSDGFGIWQFALAKDEAPGFYDVIRVLPTGSNATGSYEITDDIRGVDLTDSGWKPDIQTVAEGAYSPYQTAVIRFLDSDTATAELIENGSSRTYQVVVRSLPLISDIQAWASQRAVRNYGADVLVKAPVPCFLQLSLTIEKPPGQDDPDVAAIKTALAAVVNNLGFAGKLPASRLSDTVHNYLSPGMFCSAIDMLGRIRRPDGTWKLIRSDETLETPQEGSLMTTNRTICFFLDPVDIALSVGTIDLAEV